MWNIILLLVIVIMPVSAADFTFKLQFYVDDVEELSQNLRTEVESSNISLLSELVVSTSPTNPRWRLLTMQSSSNVFGKSIVTLTIEDNGVLAKRTTLMGATVGSLITSNYHNSVLSPTIFANTNQVLLSWNGITNLAPGFLYKISRKETIDTDIIPTVGWTAETNFTDTNVWPGSNYFYVISFVPDWLTAYFTNAASTSVEFTVNVSRPVALQRISNGFVFQGYANKVYNIFEKDRLNQATWNSIGSVSNVIDQLFILQGEQYNNKIIYVREEIE